MKSAREMFKKLGYVRLNIFPLSIDYVKQINLKDAKIISFTLKSKSYYAMDRNIAMGIDMPTFKAIQKQLEELGWLDD